MSNGLFVRIIPLAASQVTAIASSGVDPAFPAGALADRQPKTVFRTNPATGSGGISTLITIDLGTDMPVDTVALLHTGLTPAAIWAIYSEPAAAGGVVPGPGNVRLANTAFGPVPETRDYRRHGLFTTDTAFTARYIAIQVGDVSTAGSIIRLGVLVIGNRLQPAFNFELGSGRRLDDQSIVRVLPGGETHSEEGAKVPLWRATWSNLSELDLVRLWSLFCEVGIGRPMLLIEDPDQTGGLPERIHYGQLVDMQWTERVQVEKQRIELQIRELL